MKATMVWRCRACDGFVERLLILLDHPLSYALTATADVPTLYLKQFRMTLSKVPDTKDTIKFMVDTEEFTYTVDMFRVDLHLSIETPKNPFVAPKFPNIPQRIEEDYHSIKDDIPLVSVYTTGNVLVRGMLISDVLLTVEIGDTDDFKEYETVFMNVDMNQPQLVVSTQGTHRSTPRAHRTPTLTAIQEKLDEEIEKMVEGDKDEESYASEFAALVLNDDVDDSSTRIEPTDGVIKEKDVDVVTSSMEFRKKKMQTPIPSPTISPRKVSSSDKTVFEELTATVSPTTATTSKILLDHCNNVVPEMTFVKTNDMIKEEMPRLVNLAVNKDREVDPKNAQEMIAKEFATHGLKMIEELFRKHMDNTTLNIYPTTSLSTAEKSSVDLQHQLYLNMKSKPQNQTADTEI
nr:hypothetical protein [Tanacetum cinerariifolium]